MREIKFRGQIEGKWWYVRVSDDHKSGSWEQFWTLVDRQTVGQATGNQDKNGKEVYEGDIVEYLDNTSQGLVKKTVVIEDIRRLPDFTCSKWERIIGNRYEHAHLLKEGPP